MVVKIWSNFPVIFIHGCPCTNTVHEYIFHIIRVPCRTMQERAISQLIVLIPALPLLPPNGTSSRLVFSVWLVLQAITIAILNIVPLWCVYGTLQCRYTCLNNNCLPTSVLNDKRRAEVFYDLSAVQVLWLWHYLPSARSCIICFFCLLSNPFFFMLI